jgi:flagellar assembly protein FliH
MRPRIIEGSAAQSADRFDFPPVDASAADALRGAGNPGAHLLTAGQLDQLQRQVHDEAFKRGFEEGLAAGKAEAAARSARLAALGDALAQPFHGLDRAVEDELVSLAVSLATHLVRREIESDPEVLHAAVRDCLEVLSSGERDVTLHLNPDDLALVRAQLAGAPAPRFGLAADPSLARGDIRAVAGASLIDGSVAARCAEILAATRAAAAQP